MLSVEPENPEPRPSWVRNQEDEYFAPVGPTAPALWLGLISRDEHAGNELFAIDVA